MEKIHIRDAVYDEIPVYRELEEPIINKWEIQRLRYIKQLQLAHLVYPTAIHTRFDHSLGVMHISSEFVDRLLENTENLDYLKKTANMPLISDDGFKKINRVIARLAGLLHDIGHGPLGHLFEEYIIPKLFEKNNELLDKMCFSHEVLGFLIYWFRVREELAELLSRVDEFKKYVDDMIQWLDQVMIPICRDPETGRSIYHREFRVDTSGYGYFIRMIIRDFLYPADLIDYLIRDSKFTGAIEFGMINRHRLMRYTKPVPVEHVLDTLDRIDKPIIDKELFKQLPTPVVMALDERALGDLIRFLDARKLMYEYVYLHKAIRAFGWSAIKILSDDEVWYHVGFSKSLLTSLLEKPSDEKLAVDFIDKYIELTDYVLIKVRELVRNNVIRECIIREHVRSLFDYRKPYYKSIHSEPIPATPYLSINTRLSTSIREYEENLRKIIVDKTSSVERDLFEHIRVGIEQIQIYPSTAWNIQGPAIYTSINNSIRVYAVEDFSTLYHLLNTGVIRLYVDRKISDRVASSLRSVFISEVKDNIEFRRQLEKLIGLTTVSTITM